MLCFAYFILMVDPNLVFGWSIEEAQKCKIRIRKLFKLAAVMKILT